ncbi:AAA family ATPase [Bradyrhizobium ottawaense]|uniref:AAA family ATPase n=1 Tax=Bradyrhizobium ottawaense TaxID=931866 RepID=UPI001BAB673D|nr:AAA family ATPase [Bradyrhizobium ottawaense]MBR1362931.1 AAA family ATPase [Bradyrhizobium ottawaense]
MNAHAFNFTLREVALALGGVVSGNQVLAPGPSHSAGDQSLSVRLDSSAPGGFLVHSFAGDDPLRCKDYVRDKLGVRWEPTAPPRDSVARMTERIAKPIAKAGSAPAEYIYRLEDGTPYLRVKRPGFFQAHWDGKAWVNGAPKGPKIPYRLPELLASEHDDVLIVEGEKDADNASALGFTATTNPGGAGKFPAELAQYFAGKNVYILPDNDEAGEAHAKLVSEVLTDVARSVRVVRLPGLPEKGDVSDWIEAGGGADDLADLLRHAPTIETAESDDGIQELGEWVNESAEDQDPLIDDIESGSIIGRGEAGVIFGPTGTGKTAVANAFHLALASGFGLGKAHLTGQPLYPCNSGRVLVAVYEAQGDFRRRARAIALDSGVPLASLNWGIVRADLDITQERDRGVFLDRVRRDVKRHGPPALLTIDTLPAAIGGKSLNDDDVAGHCYALAHALVREHGTSVMFVAHPGKDETRGIAGSYRLQGNADFVLKTIKTKAGYRLMKAKDRSGACNRPIFDYTLKFIEVDQTSGGKPVTGAVVGSITPCASRDTPDQQPSSTPDDRWPRSLRIFRASLTTALIDAGKLVEPFGAEGPRLKAVPAAVVRQEFIAAYPAETKDAKRVAFDRALMAARKNELICSREIGGMDHLWLLEPNSTPNKQDTL